MEGLEGLAGGGVSVREISGSGSGEVGVGGICLPGGDAGVLEGALSVISM